MEKKQRSSFSGKLGFVMAAAGSAVGLGNIWRFPYLCAKYGGGIFLLIYIVNKELTSRRKLFALFINILQRNVQLLCLLSRHMSPLSQSLKSDVVCLLHLVILLFVPLFSLALPLSRMRMHSVAFAQSLDFSIRIHLKHLSVKCKYNSTCYKLIHI